MDNSIYDAFVEPVPLTVANFDMGVNHTQATQKQNGFGDKEENKLASHEKGFDSSMIMSLLPALMGNGNINDGLMEMIKPMLQGKKVAGMDISTILPLLPLLFDSGLLQKKETTPSVQVDKVININDYKILN